MKQDFDHLFSVRPIFGDERCECCEAAPARVRMSYGEAWSDLSPNCAEAAKQKLYADYADTMRELADDVPRRKKEEQMSGKNTRGTCGACAKTKPVPGRAHVACQEPNSKVFCCIVSRDRRACSLFERKEGADGDAE